MKTKLPAIDTDLATFASTKDIGKLQHAFQAVQNIKAYDTALKINPAVRKSNMQAYLRILRTVELAEDPKYNPQDLPSLNIAPPPETNLPAGVAPDAINDPLLRERYEDALTANAKKTAYVNQEVALRRFENLVRQWVLVYVSEMYRETTALKTQDELTQLVREEGTKTDFLAAMILKVKSE